MDEARYPGTAGGIDDIGGRGRIARLEGGAGGYVDHASDVHDGIGARRHFGEAVGLVERTLDPRHAALFGLRPAGEGADMPTRRDGVAHRRPADETGRAGHREDGFHSKTIWSRWTIALRGA